MKKAEYPVFREEIMTLDEAIKWLKEDLINQHPYTPERVSKAKEIAVAAMRYTILDRRHIAFTAYFKNKGGNCG